MARVTIRLDDETLSLLRHKADQQGQSVSQFVNDLVRRDLGLPIDSFFQLVDMYKPRSNGQPWNREEIYEDALKGLL